MCLIIFLSHTVILFLCYADISLEKIEGQSVFCTYCELNCEVMESSRDLKNRYNETVVKDKEEEMMVNRIMHPCREKITEEMKKDEKFKALFQEYHFSGSYYDKLSVGNKYDFDMNMVFGVPETAFEISEVAGDEYVNFLKFFVTDEKDPKIKLIMEQNYVSSRKMRDIMKTALDRALTRLDNIIIIEEVGKV